MLPECEEHVVSLDPYSLALTYLSNNGALNFFAEVGINMDLFYAMLWRHIFVVEIIKTYFELTSERINRNFLLNLKTRMFKTKSEEKARDYLVEWGEFFLERN